MKFSQLPSLMEMECEIDDIDDMFDDIITKAVMKNEPATANGSVLAPGNNFGSSFTSSQSTAAPPLPKAVNKVAVTSRVNGSAFYRSVSSAMDQRLSYGLETNVETLLRRWTLMSSMNLFASLPTYPNQPNQFNLLELPAAILGSDEIPAWPEHILQAWSNDEYQQNQAAIQMFVGVFDSIFEDLDLADSWLNLEQVLQLWLTLNNELSDKNAPTSNGNSGAGSSKSSSSNSMGGAASLQEAAKIPFSRTAVQGLLSALYCHPGISLRAWSLSFQCLAMAGSPDYSSFDMADASGMHISECILSNPQFEQMLYRFYSSADPTSTPDNRCVGPTICKQIRSLYMWIEIKSEALGCKQANHKLKEILLRVLLQLIQPTGAIAMQQGPLDAQIFLVKDLIGQLFTKNDLNAAMSIIESVCE